MFDNNQLFERSVDKLKGVEEEITEFEDCNEIN